MRGTFLSSYPFPRLMLSSVPFGPLQAAAALRKALAGFQTRGPRGRFPLPAAPGRFAVFAAGRVGLRKLPQGRFFTALGLVFCSWRLPGRFGDFRAWPRGFPKLGPGAFFYGAVARFPLLAVPGRFGRFRGHGPLPCGPMGPVAVPQGSYYYYI